VLLQEAWLAAQKAEREAEALQARISHHEQQRTLLASAAARREELQHKASQVGVCLAEGLPAAGRRGTSHSESH
jgi:hypothetical protein